MNALAYLLNKVVELKLSPTDQCVEWPFSLNKGGYGQIWFQGRIKRVHRVAFQLYHGEQAEQLVLHKCNNPKCYNPAHLYIGNHLQNAKDAQNQRQLLAAGTTQSKTRPIRRFNTKLSEKDVTEILRMLGEGKTVRYIANHFPVTYQTIDLIKLGRTWKHLPRPWQS